MNRSITHFSTAVFFALVFTVLTSVCAAAEPVVLFDQGHGQRFLVEQDRPLDLSGLASVFRQEGAQVRTGDAPLTSALLSGVDILIISGPFKPISEAETDAVLQFVREGGQLAVMVHISQPFLSLFKKLGIVISSLSVNEQENTLGSPKEFLITKTKDHPLTRNLDAFAVYGGWALKALKPEVTEIAFTSPKAWVDLNQNGELNERDAQQSFAMVASGRLDRGSFVVFGDDAIFQNQFLKGGNLLLAENLVRWFCTRKTSI